MIRIVRTDSTNPDFIGLVKQLDAYLARQDGEEHSFYNQFNQVAALRYVIVAYEGEKPVACGAIKPLTPAAMEVKRMYTLPDYRGRRIATQVLRALETWTKELGYRLCNLETGKRQPEAIALYEKCGYKRIANYGQYIGVDNSVCFEKEVSEL